MDTTVAETVNEAVEVAAGAGFEAVPAPSKTRANATDKRFMDSLFATSVSSQPYVLSVQAAQTEPEKEASLALSAVQGKNSMK
jgi:hypothetical protein